MTLRGGASRSSRRPTASSSRAASARAGGRARSSPAASRASRGSRTSASASGCRWPSPSSRATSCGMEGANSTEFDPETPYPVIDLLPEQKEVEDLGGTMRLGADPVKLARRHARARDLRRGGDLRAPPPPLRGEQPVPQAAGGRAASSSPAPSRTSGSSRSSSCPTTRSSSPASSTRSSSRARRARRRCSATSSGAALERARARVRRRRRGRALRDVLGLFLELRRDPEPAGRGARVADHVAAELAALGLDVDEDGAGPQVGSTPGNLLCRIPGPQREGTPSSSAPTSTPCRRTAPIEPVLEDGVCGTRPARSSAPTTRRPSR